MCASTLAFNTGFDKTIGPKVFSKYNLCILDYPITIIMVSYENSSGKENHKSIFENISHDRCIFVVGIEQKLLEQTSLFIFQNLNTQQAVFARAAITSSLDKCLCSSTVSARCGLFFQFPLSVTYESYCLPFMAVIPLTHSQQYCLIAHKPKHFCCEYLRCRMRYMPTVDN